MIRTISFLLISVIIISCSSFGQTEEAVSDGSLAKAQGFYSSMEHKEAYAIFNTVWADENQTLADRALAGRFIAKMDWMLYGRLEKAYKTLAQLEEIDFEKSSTYILKARVLASERKFEEAITWSGKAMQLNTSETESYKALMAYGSHVFARSKAGIVDGAKESASQIAEMNGAHEQLRALHNRNPADLELAKLYLGYSLLFQKGQEAFKAWMLFFKLRNIDEVHPSLMKSVGEFQKALRDYETRTNQRRAVEIIIKGLAESGFFEYASMLKIKEFGKAAHSDARINEIVDYHSFLKQVDKATKDFYQETTIGKVAIYAYTAQYQKACQALWESLKWQGPKPEFSQQLFDETIRERFKNLTRFDTINGHYGLYMGHFILQDRRTINQHGQSAEFRFSSVDHVISNGYQGWATDGESQVGGWATNDGSFLMIRAGLNGMVTELWSMLTDPAQNQGVLNNIERLSKLEDDMATQNPHAFLPGLKMRILVGETSEFLDSLRSTGIGKDELRFEFINLMERIAQDSKIYAHEGRHSIDMKYGFSKTSKQLEYTAKLSEIYFSYKPLFFLGTIMSGNFGNGTAHGDANLMLVKGLVEWMNKNKSEITGFDLSRPTLPQLDLLTDQQVRAAVRSLDPMAN